MILHYLRLTGRLLVRNPFITLINVFGLSTGFFVFFILWQHTQSELHSDQFRQDADQIFRISVHAQWTDDKQKWQEVDFSIGHLGFRPLVDKYSHVLDQTMFLSQPLFSEDFTIGHGQSIVMSHDPDNGIRKSFVENKVIYAEPNFLEFFSIPMIEGSQGNALSKAGAIAISQKIALKYFGNSQAVGKSLLLNDSIPLEVSGVFENLPNNTHLDFDIIISSERMGVGKQKFYDAGSHLQPYSYFKLPSGTNGIDLAEKINSSESEEVDKVVWGSWAFGKAKVIFLPLKDLVFSEFRLEPRIAKSRFTLYMLSAAAIVILAMAWINYVNLSVYSSNKRMKELFARKTVGARPVDLIAQFIIEAAMVNISSFFLAMTFFQLFRTPANVLLNFSAPVWTDVPIQTILILITTLLSGIIITGLYPAIITLNKSPKNIVAIVTNMSSGGSIGSVLTTFQFMGAVVIVICVYCVDLQLDHILNSNIGINKENVVIIDVPTTSTTDMFADIDKLRNKLSDITSVNGFTYSNSMSADNAETGLALTLTDPGLNVDTNGGVDENFLSFYDIKLIAGRNFTGIGLGDKNSILISRGAMARLGIKSPHDAVGLKVFLFGRPSVEVIGVFEDYQLRPFINQDNTEYGGHRGYALTYRNYLQQGLTPKKISIRVQSQDFENAIATIKDMYQSVFPAAVFNWYFLEDQINNQYQSDLTLRNQILFFSILAIGIACIGLLGMVTNKVVEKVKEIGIRKVLGARLHHIAVVLLGTTTKQITLATVTGIPIAYYLIQEYLQKFSLKIELHWWHFTLPLSFLLLLMVSTISIVLIRAAAANPVESLRND